MCRCCRCLRFSAAVSAGVAACPSAGGGTAGAVAAGGRSWSASDETPGVVPDRLVPSGASQLNVICAGQRGAGADGERGAQWAGLRACGRARRARQCSTRLQRRGRRRGGVPSMRGGPVSRPHRGPRKRRVGRGEEKVCQRECRLWNFDPNVRRRRRRRGRAGGGAGLRGRDMRRQLRASKLPQRHD